MENELIEKSDEELVAMTLFNKESFVFLVKKYEKQLLRYILRISNISHEEAEDALQEVFIKVYRNLNEFDKSLKFSSWIYRIAHNETINYYRKSKARPEKIELNEDSDLIENLMSDLNTEHEIDNKILRDKLLKILDSVDIKYKEVVYLKFFEERSYEEISDILKKPIGSVSILISRAKKKLKKLLI